MEKDFLIELFNSSKSIAEICISLYGKKNGGMHNRVLKLFKETGYDWDNHLKEIEKSKKVYCLNCGKEITGKERSRKKFCDSSCAAQYNNKQRTERSEESKLKTSESLKKYYSNNPMKAETKSAISEGLKKYVSKNKKTDKKLWEEYCKTYKTNVSLEEYINNIKGRRKNYQRIKEQKIKEKPKCIVCGKDLPGYNTLFCSKECKNEHDKKLYEEYIERWKKGEESGCTPSFKIHKYVKRYLEATNHNSCQRCGWHEINEYTGNVPLQIHHIDGDCTNNSPDNIQLLCPNCHALTENFGSRNKNSKRVFRKQKLFKQEILNTL